MSIPRPKAARRSAGWREIREQTYRHQLEMARGVLRARRWQLRGYIALLVLAIFALGAGAAVLVHAVEGWVAR
jgi:hypothetical protein